ncbi:MAG: family 10 glycosylhydrolase [Planctomycetota bacterium]
MKATLALVVLSLLTSCGFLPQRSGDIDRAVWVTRWDFKTEADVRDIVRNCARAGFDTVFFQVRGQGTVLYASDYEPWCQEYGFRYPGFDPLQAACDEGRRQGVAVHAWVNVLAAWKGDTAPPIQNHLYRTRPQWFLYDQTGQRQPLNDGYVFLNPCLPEVRAYLAGICREIAHGYAVQGIHLDYMRFPDQAEGGPDYPRDERTVALYKKATGLEPAEDLGRWNEWKTAQVTRLLDDIDAAVRGGSQRCLVSAAVFPIRKAASVHQDRPRWVEGRKVAAVFPMLYNDSDQQFRADLDEVAEVTDRSKVFPAIGVYKHARVEQTLGQMDSVAAHGFPGCGLYAYSSFFRTRNADEPIEAQDPDIRGQRREALISRPRMK